MALKSGHRVTPLICEEAAKQYEQFGGNRVGTIRLDPDGWFFTSPFIIFADKLYEFKFKPSDIVVMTFPKCGTTWTQEIVWTLLNNPNLENPKGTLPVNLRCPFLELDFITKGLPKDVSSPGSFIHNLFTKTHPDRDPSEGIFLQFAEFASDPRIIKTHLPFSLLSPKLPDTCKIIYMAREPKDVAVSYCHHSRLLKDHNFIGSTSEFVDHFVNDTTMFSPYWKHVKEAWNRRHQPNIHFCFFEDLRADPKAEIIRLQKFFNLTLTDDQINNIVHHTSFQVMKEREGQKLVGSNTGSPHNAEVEEKDGGFFRKGISGDYKNHLSFKDIDKIDKWTRENTKNMENDFKWMNKTTAENNQLMWCEEFLNSSLINSPHRILFY